MAMEKYSVADRRAQQQAELKRVDAELDRRGRARADILDFEKVAQNETAIEQLRERRTALLKALADQ